jgi:ribonuclease E
VVLESNRDLVVRRLLECLGRDRTKHQVAEVTSLGLVQMTRKRVGSGLIEVFSETCDHCNGRGIIVQSEPVERPSNGGGESGGGGSAARSRGRRGRTGGREGAEEQQPAATPSGPTPAQIAAAAHAAALKSASGVPAEGEEGAAQDQPVLVVHETEPEEQEPARAAEPEPAAAPAASPAEVPAAAAAAPAPQTVSSAPADEAPAAPKRRRRGRVVAPAGPPRPVTAEPAAESSGEGAGGAS